MQSDLPLWSKKRINNLEKEEVPKNDEVTCLAFDDTGDLLAVGDKSGRIFVYKPRDNGDWDLYCAFTSHESEFDYLKSLEIEEKINNISWLPKRGSGDYLLSSNDKTIKLWKMSEKLYEAYGFNVCLGANDLTYPEDQLKIPKYRKCVELTVEVRPRRIFANAHAYHINSVSLSSDQETFLSADDLRVNLWNLENVDEAFTVVDMKPENLFELGEVINCARYHTQWSYLFGYATSSGLVKLCDTRVRALCDKSVLVCQHTDSVASNWMELMLSISDFRFSNCGNYVLARDFLTLKVFDIRSPSAPCALYQVHEPFRSVVNLDSERIFDKFLCAWSEDGRRVATGSFGGLVRMFEFGGASAPEPGLLLDVTTEASTHMVSKRYVYPDTSLGRRLHVDSLCVAPLPLLAAYDEFCLENDLFASNSSKSSRKGAKRRKQSMLNVSRDTRASAEDLSSCGMSEADSGSDDPGCGLHNFPGNADDIMSCDTLCIPSAYSDEQLQSENVIQRLYNLQIELENSIRPVTYDNKVIQVAWHPKKSAFLVAYDTQLVLCSERSACTPQVQTEEVPAADDKEHKLTNEKIACDTANCTAESGESLARKRKKDSCDSSMEEEGDAPAWMDATTTS